MVFRLEDLLHGEERVEQRDHAGALPAGMQVGRDLVGHRIQTVPEQEIPVEGRFDGAVADALALLLGHVRMAAAVQREVAQDPVEIAQGGLPVRRGVGVARCLGEEVPAGALVIPVAGSVHVVPDEGLVIEQKIRPVDAEIKEIPVAIDQRLRLRRQLRQNVPAEPVMRVSGRQNTHFLPIQLYHIYAGLATEICGFSRKKGEFLQMARRGFTIKTTR